MDRTDFLRDVTGVAALNEPVRRDLYLYVVAQDGPVGRDQAADGVGVARHTAKFHSDKLVEDGLLDTEFKRLTGRRGSRRRAPHQALPAIRPRQFDGDPARAPLRPRRAVDGAGNRRVRTHRRAGGRVRCTPRPRSSGARIGAQNARCRSAPA